MKIIVEIPDDDCLTCPLCYRAEVAYGNMYCMLDIVKSFNATPNIIKKDGKYQRTKFCKSRTLDETNVVNVTVEGVVYHLPLSQDEKELHSMAHFFYYQGILSVQRQIRNLIGVYPHENLQNFLRGKNEKDSV